MNNTVNNYYFDEIKLNDEETEVYEDKDLKKIFLKDNKITYQDKIGDLSYTEKPIDTEKSKYEVKTSFEGKKSLSKNQIVVNTIQTILDESKKELIKCDINDIVPMAFLLNKYNVDLIKKISNENSVNHKDVYKVIISEVFDKNLISSLNMAISKLNKKEKY